MSLFGVPFIGMIVVDDPFSPKQLLTMVVAYAIPVLILLIICLLVSNKSYIPFRIEIIPNKTVKSYCMKKIHIHSIHQVRKVIDYGDFYSIRINQQFEHGPFLCQKDLLTKGSIEEFEKTFEGKIIRKIDDKNHENRI